MAYVGRMDKQDVHKLLKEGQKPKGFVKNPKTVAPEVDSTTLKISVFINFLLFLTIMGVLCAK